MLTQMPPGATPLDDTTGLIPRHITTKDELNELEFANINKAVQKYFLGKITDKKAPFDVPWLFKVHREMYGDVWMWAGQTRTTELNIGAPPLQIRERLQQLVQNFRHWEFDKTMTSIEIAARLHHGLVKIHPFKNGNGRWARFVTNIYLKKSGSNIIRWPEETLQVDSPFRKNYIAALQKADQGQMDELIQMHHQVL